MPLDYAALKSELQTDPSALGYAAKLTAGDYISVAALVNFVRDGSAACPVNGVVGAAITIRRTDIAVADIYAAISVADYTALPTSPTATQLSTERRYLAWLTGLAALTSVRLVNDDGTDTPLVGNFKAMFASGTATLTRLNALASRNGSRGEQLFGCDTSITDGDVKKALGLTN